MGGCFATTFLFICYVDRTMQYDPIKKSLGKVFRSPSMRILFYKLLDLLLLRTWHIKKELKRWAKNTPKDSKILDAGSGFGQYTYSMSSMSYRYGGLGEDVQEEQVEDCNGFFNKMGREKRVG